MIRECQTNIDVEFRKGHNINKSYLTNNECGTKHTESDQTYSTTSTSTVIGNQQNNSHSTVDNVVPKNNVPKVNNSTKYDSNDIKKEGQKKIYRG